MQAKSVEFSRPEIVHPIVPQAAVVYAPCGIGFVTSFSPHPVVLCSSGDVIGRPAEAGRCASRDRGKDAGAELQEPVDLSLHRDEQSPAVSRQHPASHGTTVQSQKKIVQTSCTTCCRHTQWSSDEGGGGVRAAAVKKAAH